jgi:hypothetical protein
MTLAMACLIFHLHSWQNTFDRVIFPWFLDNDLKATWFGAVYEIVGVYRNDVASKPDGDATRHLTCRNAEDHKSDD